MTATRATTTARRLPRRTAARTAVLLPLALYLAAVATPQAAYAQPTVTTGSASNVTQTTATLNGAVNPNEDEVTSCLFEYGTTIAYGSAIPCAEDPGSGSIPLPVSADLSGLAPATTYHFRVVATNGGGTDEGADATFATPAHTCQTDPAAPHCQPEPPRESQPQPQPQPQPEQQRQPQPRAGTAVVAARAVVRRGRAALRMRCNGQRGARCRGKVALRTRTRVRGRMRKVAIGRARYNLPVRHRLRTVQVRLTKVGRRLVARSRRPVRVRVAGPGVRNRAVRLAIPKRRAR